jgi:hypothetical protein
MDDLRDILNRIEQKGAEQNLHVVRGLPTIPAPEHTWQAEWIDYLETAGTANATLLYIQADPFDLDKENTLFSQTQQAIRIQQLRPTDPTQDEQEQWLLERLVEQTEQWRDYNNRIGSIKCLWFVSGIGHSLTITTPWYRDYESAATRALEEAETVELENRRLRTEEAAFFLMEAAREVASHERFPEATNNEKRAYMVDQLYPGLTPQQRTEVVGLAQAIHWWDIAPAENATKEQQARDLRARGETIRNIAALLKMPETRVRAILEG